MTFSGIRIHADVASPDGHIIGEKEHILPLQEGVIELYCDPGNWLYDRERWDELCNIRLWVVA